MNILGVSTQLYVWSQMPDSASKGLVGELSEVKTAGFSAFETNLSIVSDAEKVRSLLENYDLQISSLYSGGSFHTKELAQTSISEILNSASFASNLGVRSITLNPNPKSGGGEKTDDELSIQASNLNELGKMLYESYGMSLFIHNHTPEIVNNAREFRSYCDLTDPTYVNVCIDVHWVYRGGVDPFLLTREYGNRIKAMHIRNSKDGIWTEDFNDGDIDYRAYRDLLEEINYDGWITLELAYESSTKITRPLVENAKLSREYIRKIFGK
ncbi:MAG: sugar phosphate isomerase/epimerase family protein [bacterium]